jgi:hypothetical protein
MPVFWGNRLGATPEQLGPSGIESGPDLVALDAWMSRRS